MIVDERTVSDASALSTPPPNSKFGLVLFEITTLSSVTFAYLMKTAPPRPDTGSAALGLPAVKVSPEIVTGMPWTVGYT